MQRPQPAEIFRKASQCGGVPVSENDARNSADTAITVRVPLRAVLLAHAWLTISLCVYQ